MHKARGISSEGVFYISRPFHVSMSLQSAGCSPYSGMKNSRTSMQAPLIAFRASLMPVLSGPFESLTTSLQKRVKKICKCCYWPPITWCLPGRPSRKCRSSYSSTRWESRRPSLCPSLRPSRNSPFLVISCIYIYLTRLVNLSISSPVTRTRTTGSGRVSILSVACSSWIRPASRSATTLSKVDIVAFSVKYITTTGRVPSSDVKGICRPDKNKNTNRYTC